MKKEKRKAKCKYCEQDFQSWRPQKYCSDECRARYKNGIWNARFSMLRKEWGND